jgi:peptidoglycan/LPS O-acetylase OafA/YrhL
MKQLSHGARAPRLEGIQVLRFVAAFLVMCAHAKMVLRDDEVWSFSTPPRRLAAWTCFL